MLQDFKKHIEENFPTLKEKKLLIAISGGLDSVVLTHLLHHLKYSVSLAHCNFTLRGNESDLDEAFVKELAKKHSIPIFTKSFNTKSFADEHKLSIQVAARELRYKWFASLAANIKFDFILTAHHADDNLETIIFNLTRGTGIDGLTGIPKKNGNILRLLIPFSRVAIENYAIAKKLNWREDKSNASTKYARNKIRHKVIPVLKELNPNLLDSLQNTVQHLQDAKSIVEAKIKEVKKEVIEEEKNTESLKIRIDKLTAVENAKAYLYQILKEYHFTEWNDVYHLLEAQSGKYVVSKTHQLLKDRKHLILTKRKPEKDTKNKFFIEKETKEIQQPVPLKITNNNNKTNANKKEIYVDKDLLNYPLIVRKWEKGDYIYPTGMLGKKKISKFFKDQKFSLVDKQNTWLLCDAKNNLIWIVGHRQDRRFLGKKNVKITTE